MSAAATLYIGGQVGYAFGQDGHLVPTEGARFTGTDHGGDRRWARRLQLGGGVEYAITNDFSLRAEYRYTDFGDRSDLVAGFVPVYGHTIEQMARGGFSFKIDAGGPAPVVARY